MSGKSIYVVSVVYYIMYCEGEVYYLRTLTVKTYNINILTVVSISLKPNLGITIYSQYTCMVICVSDRGTIIIHFWKIYTLNIKIAGDACR